VIVGVPRETRSREHRVALTPAGVKSLVEAGNPVFVESGAGQAAGHPDADYQSAGAAIAYARFEAFARAELLASVCAPVPRDYELLRPGQTVFAFWGLPTARVEDVRALLERRVNAVALEAIENDDGSAPVLTAMSEIAGALSVGVGAGLLLNEFGGKGILLGGAPGVPPAQLVVLGAGVLGRAAARAALGAGALVTLLDISVEHLRRALAEAGQRVTTMLSTRTNLEKALSFADLVIAAPAVHGERAPLLVTRGMLKRMKPRSVVMDLAIDMGGCLETSRPTAFPDPVYEVDGVLHFCVPNLPSIAARTATLALTNVTLPYIAAVAEQGLEPALLRRPDLRRGTCLYDGRCLRESLARSFGLPHEPLRGDAAVV
jgi:alanine dehydrogenase